MSRDPQAPALTDQTRRLFDEARSGLPTQAATRADDDPLVELRVELGHAMPSVGQVEQLRRGSVLVLDEPVDSPVLIKVDGQPVARGEIRVLDGYYCVRVTHLLAGLEPATDAWPHRPGSVDRPATRPT